MLLTSLLPLNALNGSVCHIECSCCLVDLLSFLQSQDDLLFFLLFELILLQIVVFFLTQIPFLE